MATTRQCKKVIGLDWTIRSIILSQIKCKIKSDDTFGNFAVMKPFQAMLFYRVLVFEFFHNFRLIR